MFWWPLLVLATPLAECGGATVADGGNAQVLAVGDVASIIVCNDEYVYWMGRPCDDGGVNFSFGGLYRTPVAGGASEFLSPSAGASMACDSQYLYFWDAAERLSRLTLADASVTTLTPPRVNMTGSIATDGNGVYWVDINGAHTVVDAGIVDLVSTPADQGLAAGSDRIFFGFEKVDGDAGVMTVAVDGAAPTVSWSGLAPSGMTLSASDVWFLAETATGSTSLVRMPRDGGLGSTVVDEAGEETTYNNIATDSVHVYWLRDYFSVGRATFGGEDVTTIFDSTLIPQPLAHGFYGLTVDSTGLYLGIAASFIPPSGPTTCGGLLKVPK